MPWRVMRNGTTSQYTRGRADEVAVYGAALPAETIGAHFEAGRDVTDTVAPAAPAGLTATARLERVELDWSDVADTGCRRLRRLARRRAPPARSRASTRRG